jgi:hypothetical protein
MQVQNNFVKKEYIFSIQFSVIALYLHIGQGVTESLKNSRTKKQLYLELQCCVS